MAHRVSREFTRIYYQVMNDNPDFLHQFYGHDSKVTVSETQDDGSNLTVRADTLELIKGLTLRMFADVRVSLTNITPQLSLAGSVQLMVSGVMHQKNCDEERLFTQALLLAKQNQGYFVLNDTVHVHSRSSSWKVLNVREERGTTETVAETAKGVPTPPQETEEAKEEMEETTEVNEPTSPPKVQNPKPTTLSIWRVQEAVVETVAVVEPAASPELTPAAETTVVEDEPVGPPVRQNVMPIEKPPVTQPVVPTPPVPSIKRSYKDALKAKRQDPTTAAK